MNPLQRALRAIDRAQQRNNLLAFLIAVQKKVGDDNAGTLIANLAYTGFLSLFPLLLILVTILGIVAGNDPSLAKTIERSALSQFPIIGTDLTNNITALHRNSGLSLAIGLLGLLWGASALSKTALYAMAEVWSLPGVERPGFLPRMGRAFLFLPILGASAIVSGFLSSYGIVGGQGLLIRLAAEVVSLAVSIGAYLAAFRVLTPKVIRLRQLVLGSVIGGVGWTILQAVGGFLVARNLKHTSDVYGFFAIVLGLIAWIYLAARLAIYAAEASAVLAYRLWPRSLVMPPLLEADRRSLTLQAKSQARRPEQRITVTFDEDRLTHDETGPVAPSAEAPGAQPGTPEPMPEPAEEGPRRSD